MTDPGLVAELPDADALLDAVRDLRALGLVRLEAFTPHPLVALDPLLAAPRSPLPGWTLAGALCGGGATYALLWWINVVDFPIDVGGRPLHAWPMFVPVVFEIAVLSAAVSTFVAWLVVCRLPQPWDPLFELDVARPVSVDGWLLAVSSEDPRFDEDQVRARLVRAGALAVHPLPDLEEAS